jgi:hypothetical protein
MTVAFRPHGRQCGMARVGSAGIEVRRTAEVA